MKGNASEFEADLNAMGVQIEADALTHKREAMLDFLGQAVHGTPVGQPRLWKSKPPKGYVGGFHRAQWQVSSGEPASGTVSNRSAGEVIAAGESALDRIDLERTGWVVNNGPAIAALEFDGHSSQAPDGWVLAALERTKARYE